MKSCPACNTRYDDHTTFCVKDGSPVVPDVLTPQAPMIGQLIGDRYRIIKKIGEGGMGEVYVAEHIHIEKKVALKLLRPEVLSNAEAVARFRQEARSASSIGHDNIISIDDFGTLPDGRVYMAMEYLQGQALNDMIGREPLPLPRALDILIQVARGLAAAHAKGITHRDMKPENVFVTHKEGRDVPKILDFGIAKVSGGDTAQNLTVAGTIFGTPFYMAPEQAMGGKMDHRCDIYAMGIILYEVFCGTVPFKAETFMGILTQHITMQPVPPSEMASRNGRICPHDLESIILKAIQKEPANRYQTMGELANALIEFYRFHVGPSATTAQPWAGASWGTPSSSYPIPGSNTQQRPAEKKGNGALVAAIVGAVVVLGGGGIAWVALSPKPAPGGTPDAGKVVVKGPPDAGHGPVVVVVPDAPVKIVIASPPDAPTKTVDVPVHPSQKVDVTISVSPPEAFIYVAGSIKSAGQGDAVISVPRGQKTKVTIRLNRYLTETLVLDGTKTGLHVNLKPAPIDIHSPDLKAPDDDGLVTPKAH